MKQRLVGAIVMVALAVIFLPMLLDGSGHSGPRDIAIELPPEPQSPPNRLEASRDHADTSLTRRAANDSGSSAQPEIAVAEPGRADSERHGEGETDDARTDGADAAEPDAAAEGDTDAGAPTEETSVDAAPAADAEGWVVQVGSFTRETNALVLRDRLREADFEAFAARADDGERTLWRVRIGPVATREEADRLSERVTEQRGEPALVMSHP